MYTAIAGSTICGIYGATHISTANRTTPSKGRSHSAVWNKNDYSLTYYNGSGNRYTSIHFNKHNIANPHQVPHWHFEQPIHSLPINNPFRYIWDLIRRF